MATTPVQLTYSDFIAAPFAGVLVDSAVNETASAINTEASAEIPFGWGVARDNTAPFDVMGNGGKLPAATTDKFFGISRFSHSYSLNPANLELGTVGMKPGVMMNLLRRGRIWAICEDGCSPGAKLFVRCTAAGAGKGSLLAADPGGSTVLVPISKIGEWQSKAAALALAILEVTASNA